MTNAVEEKISVLIVDDHTIVRRGLRTLLELQTDIEVIGEAGNGEEAVEKTQQLLPDVVLMDLVMPKMDGITATRRIRSVCPNTRVIALTSFGDDDKVFPAIKAGALGYLLKDVSPNDLIKAIHDTQRGEANLHPEIAKKLMDEFLNQSKEPAPGELTRREMDVLRLIAKGMNNREIAAELVISEKTVKVHVSNMLSKLHLADRTQAAIYALKHNLSNSD